MPASTGAIGLSGDVVSLRLHTIREFVFVAARIDGVQGKLMFDTGGGQALDVNDHLVPLTGGISVGKGFVGSGQSFEVKRYPTVASVEIDDQLRFRDVPDVKGYDLSFIEDVTPDFLGFLGHAFYDGYLFKLDYRRERITFYRLTEARRESRDYLEGETTIAVLTFETRKLPNHPIVHLTISGIPFVGCFDTGQLGDVNTKQETLDELSGKGLLAPLATGDDPTFELGGLRFSDSFTAAVSGTRVMTEPGVAAGPLGITEPDVIDLGYAFLRQYKTVWDFDERKIYLLAP